jgi:hypothetical protein
MPRSVLITLAGAAFNGDAPPSEFRLFKAGINETTKGEFLFDAKAAEMVMAACGGARQVDYAIDLEHLSLDTEARHYNPDALGHFKLEVRNGELWAVNVTWNPDGARRLSEKTQRYVSPAFITDDDNRDHRNRERRPRGDARNAQHARARRGQSEQASHEPQRPHRRPRAPLSIAKRQAHQARRRRWRRRALGQVRLGQERRRTLRRRRSPTSRRPRAATDIDATFAAMEAAVKACDAFEQAVTAIAGGSGGEPVPDAGAAAASADPDAQQQMARERAELMTLKAEKAKREEDEKVAKLAAEMHGGAARSRRFVKPGRTPHRDAVGRRDRDEARAPEAIDVARRPPRLAAASAPRSSRPPRPPSAASPLAAASRSRSTRPSA